MTAPSASRTLRPWLVVVLLCSGFAPALPQRDLDFDRMRRQQAETDQRWKAASAGYMQMQKIT